jgi:hypothetical protein
MAAGGHWDIERELGARGVRGQGNLANEDAVELDGEGPGMVAVLGIQQESYRERVACERELRRQR